MNLAPLSSGAFAGTVNLHAHAGAIAEAADAYEALRKEAAKLTLQLERDHEILRKHVKN